MCMTWLRISNYLWSLKLISKKNSARKFSPKIARLSLRKELVILWSANKNWSCVNVELLIDWWEKKYTFLWHQINLLFYIKYEIYSKLTIKIPERHHWRRSGIFIVNFEHISHSTADHFHSSKVSLCQNMCIFYDLTGKTCFYKKRKSKISIS